MTQQIKNRHDQSVIYERSAPLHAGYDCGVVVDAVRQGVSLANADLRGFNLAYLRLYDGDFRGADLRGVNFKHSRWHGCDLSGVTLDDNYNGLVIPDIHKRVYKAASRPNALDMSVWHSECGTAHCRAGWVIVLAGRAGKRLESEIGTGAAATIIYQVSDPTMSRSPDFNAPNQRALADMRRLAGIAD